MRGPFWRWLPIALAGLAGASIVVVWLAAREPAADETADFAYPAPSAAACASGVAAERSASLRTPGDVAFDVKAPRNYDRRYAHPLLVIYAPAGMDRSGSERFTGMTTAATRAGFVVAYVDHARLTLSGIPDFGTVPEIVARGWCIDRRRVFLTGHSDGATVATALALAAGSSDRYAAIAPSGAGFTAVDLAQYRCPPPLGVLVLHGAADDHFPGFGRQAAEWWARCNGCAREPEQRSDGCLEYRGCAPAGRTVYCEHNGRHTAWPKRNEMMIEFFGNAPAS
jgi:polyhydroxybutyrate depolymerase